MKKSTARGAMFIVILIVGVVGYYTYLSNRNREAVDEANMTPVQSALSRDLEMDYPATPKEVIKYYNQILKCFYNEECTDAELEELGNKARELYDEELLDANELGTYMMRLKQEVADYKEQGKIITSASVAASTNVVYDEVDGYYFAKIACGYSVMQGKVNTPTKQVYLLRRDDDRRWKIYGWQLSESEQATSESAN
ncbi:MAG: hypothetical protein IJ327_05610 [Lachnospiraceae bacterium]|nr:hypothetical protein [Lachnospiraceae bacterium]